MKKRMYISIPVTGQEEASRVKAAQLQKHFESQGYEVVNPHEIGHHLEELFRKCLHTPPVWADYMEWCFFALKNLSKNDTVYFCKGWEQSAGCIEEKNLSNKLGVKMMYE